MAYETLRELRYDSNFASAMQAFELMQESNIQVSNENRVMISELLNDNEWWNSLDNSERQAIGRLIAHNWPLFAQACQITVNIAFVESDADGKGIYRIVRYRRNR